MYRSLTNEYTKSKGSLDAQKSNPPYSQPAYSLYFLYDEAKSEQDRGGAKQNLHSVVVDRPFVQIAN